MSTVFIVEDEKLASEIEELVRNSEKELAGTVNTGNSLNDMASVVYSKLPITIHRKVGIDNIEGLKTFRAEYYNSIFSVSFFLLYDEDSEDSVAATSFSFRWNTKEKLPEFFKQSIGCDLDEGNVSPNKIFSDCMDVDGGFCKEVIDKVHKIRYEVTNLKNNLSGYVMKYFPDASDDMCERVVNHILYNDGWR